MIRLASPSRLHFGLFRLPAEEDGFWTDLQGNPIVPARHFGGVGLMIDKPGVQVSVETIAKSLRRQWNGLGAPVVVSGQYRLGDIRHNYADISTIGRLLAFSPKVPLEEGMGRFVRWVNTQPIVQNGAEDGLDRANRELIERGLMKA